MASPSHSSNASGSPLAYKYPATKVSRNIEELTSFSLIILNHYDSRAMRNGKLEHLQLYQELIPF
jgi:hypothetical protein